MLNHEASIIQLISPLLEKQNLEERLARRKYLADMHENEQKVTQGVVEHRQKTIKELFQFLYFLELFRNWNNRLNLAFDFLLL